MSWKDTTLSSFLIVICSFSDYFSIKHRTWQVQATVWFIRYYHQSRIYESTNFFNEDLLWFLFLLANWEKTLVLNQWEVCVLFQLLKLRKIRGKNWWNYLMNSYINWQISVHAHIMFSLIVCMCIVITIINHHSMKK